MLKHLAERREHEREVAQKALSKERQLERRADGQQHQEHVLHNKLSAEVSEAFWVYSVSIWKKDE